MPYKTIKRGLDVLGAALGLALIAPLVPLIALAIKLESRGPVFVRLPRVSGGKIIYVYKFRSMVAGAHEKKWGLAHLNERGDGPFFKIKNDPRLTRVGKVLRKFRLDEFPQLMNVALGDLSLVGPRPHEPEEVVLYPDPYKPLILAKAGVTGLSQVNGASGLPFMKELELDFAYAKTPSLVTDAKILLKTARILFTDPNAV
ncbi:MAG: sugar transferase [Candidatus Harrisonbacteria bacterium]|nr:sugar transferase [Candidatus Harrisonbacteria bacterium]